MSSSQLGTTWRKVWNAYTKSKPKKEGDEKARSIQPPTEESPQPQDEKSPIFIDNPTSSPLLRLPAELRNQIYSHLDLDQQTIEVLSLPKDDYIALDQDGVPMKHNPYPNHQLWYRIEDSIEQTFSLDRVNQQPRKRRCISIQGLFAISRVCRQLRDETAWFFFERPMFAFSDVRYNYVKAFPAFLNALGRREKGAIRAIRWPFSQASEYYRCMRSGKEMQAPYRAFSEEFKLLTGLQYVALQYRGTDVGHMLLEEDEDRTHARAHMDAANGWDYVQVANYRRDLAMTAMRMQLPDRAGLEIECKKMSNYL